MPRFFICLILLFVTTAAEAEDLIYSDWTGGCTINQVADTSCIMRREARSPTGQQLGFIAFGQAEASRFLFVGFEQSGRAMQRAFVIRIDSEPIPHAKVGCRREPGFCSTIIVVDEHLLERLAAGTLLIVESRNRREIKMQIPLSGFQQARRQLF